VILLVCMAGYVWLGNPQWLAPAAHAGLAQATSLTGQRQLVAVALEIEDFRRSTGHLPADLGQLGLGATHVSYLILPGGRYELRLGTSPHTIIYRGVPGGEAEMRQESAP
jgi:hypothetical protein